MRLLTVGEIDQRQIIHNKVNIIWLDFLNKHLYSNLNTEDNSLMQQNI